MKKNWVKPEVSVQLMQDAQNGGPYPKGASASEYQFDGPGS